MWLAGGEELNQNVTRGQREFNSRVIIGDYLRKE
jgi:hypothetical protein